MPSKLPIPGERRRDEGVRTAEGFYRGARICRGGGVAAGGKSISHNTETSEHYSNKVSNLLQ